MQNVDVITIAADEASLSHLLVTSKNNLRPEVSQLIGHMRSCQSQGSVLYNLGEML